MSRLSQVEGISTDITALRARVYRHSFWEFVKRFWEYVPGAGRMQANWHMEYLCQELQHLAELVFQGKTREYDLLVNISPGTSKSSIVSILYPCWIWTRMPSARILSASHTEMLCLDLATKARDVMRGELYQECFPEIEFSTEQDAKGYYRNTVGGDRLTCTVAGKSPMGFHADFLIIDDPIDPKKAVSEAELKTAREFMTQVIPSRKTNKSVSVTMLIMQRLHREDPSAVMMERSTIDGATAVKHICLPARLLPNIQPPELAERYINNLMDPTRLGESVLKEQEILLGRYGFASQYEQNPVPLGGGMFLEEYFNSRKRAAPRECKRIRYWDRACLVQNTSVTTKRGQLPIQDIVVEEDYVLTRGSEECPIDYRKVLWSGMTKYASGIMSVEFANGMIVSGTPDHKIWVIGKGWVELEGLVSKDRVISCADTACMSSDVLQPWTTVVFSIFRRFEDPMPVYDLAVEGTHEFFANGILVHNSTQDGGCYTAGVLFSKDKEGDYYIEHVIHGQWEPTQRNQKMRAAAMRDRSRYGPKHEPVIVVEAEGGSSGRDAWKGVVRALAGFYVREDRVTGDKDKRAEPLSVQFAAGNVHLVDNGESEGTGKADWDINGYVSEFTQFKPEPGIKRLGKYKDQVDATCLISGTEILTKRGLVRIEDVIAGEDKVVDRHGKWNRVIKSGMTNKVDVIWTLTCPNGCSVSGTGDHRIWSNDDWVEMQNMKDGGVLSYLPTVEGEFNLYSVRYREPVPVYDLEVENTHEFFANGILVHNSGAFNILVGEKVAGTLKSYSINPRRGKDAFRIFVCSKDELANTIIGDNLCLLISISDPALTIQDTLSELAPEVPLHGIGNLLDTYFLKQANFNPDDWHTRWEDIVPRYNKKPEELVMSKEKAKPLWHFITKRREPPAQIIVIHDDGDGRAISVAYAICDAFRQPRGEVICTQEEVDVTYEGNAPNQHIYEVMKLSRSCVV